MRITVVRTMCPAAFEVEVNQLLDEGWKLHGHMCSYYGYNAYLYVQALIKEEIE